jgi:tetratricopeptide (TPR) repeat protein
MTPVDRLRRFAAMAVPFVILGSGCVPEDQRTGSIDESTWAEVQAAYSPAVKAQIDSANVAYKAADYPAALAHYERALEMEDDVAAAWFGLYMAHHAMGNLDEADAALERSRELLPGASLLRENPDSAS